MNISSVFIDVISDLFMVKFFNAELRRGDAKDRRVKIVSILLCGSLRKALRLSAVNGFSNLLLIRNSF